WANRGAGQMVVWIPNSESAAIPARPPTLVSAAKVTSSGRKSPRPIADPDDPASSRDNGYYFDWFPERGTSGWVEYAFEKPATVSESELYCSTMPPAAVSAFPPPGASYTRTAPPG